MSHVRAIGGVFLKSSDTEALKIWYRETLDIDFDEYLAAVLPVTKTDAQNNAYSVLGLFPEDTDYFSPSQKDMMINFRVEDLPGLIAELEKKGVPVTGPEKFEQGLFAWIVDPEGRKIELWELPANL